MAISEQERERRKQRALTLASQPHPDDPSRRRFGGRQPGSGRKRQARATEIAAEKVAEKGGLLAEVIIDGMSELQTPQIRLQSAKLAIDLEHREAEMKLKEGRAVEELSEEELVEALVAASLNGSVIDGTATEIDR